jgi:hypothetical protein
MPEDYERQLWKELNALLADAIPQEAKGDDAERAIMLALMGHDSEAHALHEQVRRLAEDGDGYLREKLAEDNPVSRARRRIYGKWANLRLS